MIVVDQSNQMVDLTSVRDLLKVSSECLHTVLLSDICSDGSFIGIRPKHNSLVVDDKKTENIRYLSSIDSVIHFTLQHQN